MKIPVSWVRDFVDLAVDPEQLADDLTSVGLACDGIERFGAEAVLDLDITTNRVDAMNMYGVAREAATFYGLPLKSLDLSFPEAGGPSSDSLRVEIEAADLCPRFSARVFDVRVGPSPAWLKDRLELAGQRSINNIVDLSNYVMLEMGQPTHAFDLSKLRGGVLKARMAGAGEVVKTLDETERALAATMGVVADAQGALAVAGIMGGASSEISGATTTMALEAAYWNPLLIRRAAKALGMHTDASHRFERGADPQAGPVSIARFANLANKGAMATARPVLLQAQGEETRPRRLTLNLGNVDARLGAAIPAAEARATLTRLGFEIAEPDPGAAAHLGTAGAWDVLVPTWRGDCTREVDLIEEVARHHDLMKIARTVPASRRAASLTPAQRTERQLKALLSGLGYREALHVNFVSSAKCDPSQGPMVKIANPLSVDQDALRTSLVMPGLLEALERNQRHGARDIQFFETGRTFSPSAEGPVETPRLALLVSGTTPRGWAGKPRPLDFFDLKRTVEEILSRHSSAGLTLSREGAPPFLHPGRSVVIRLDGRACGYLGEVHPDTIAVFSLKDRPVVAEIAFDALTAREALAFTAFSRFPEVVRDLSILAPLAASAAEITALARAQAGAAVRRVELIDRFEGAGVPAGQVSLTLSFVFQDEGRTLSSEEVERSMDAVRASFSERGYTARGVA
ncbi:MAG TPA: phenylalanine--tRNA ligase subunit beta [Vicinamibacteria bacterium]|nr:phenylalanine--tRNA ligase subunit beta [Vicinamibacteria bacterium]